MILYHGSASCFDDFDFSKVGLNGTSEGKGFYFTDNKTIATNYAHNGFLYTVALNFKKPIYSKQRNITEKELIKIFVHLQNEDEFLTNFIDVDSEGIQKGINEALRIIKMNNCDVDIISEIANISGSIEMANKAFYEILGYDCIIDNNVQWTHNGIKQVIYIALVSDIIKIEKVEKI